MVSFWVHTCSDDGRHLLTGGGYPVYLGQEQHGMIATNKATVWSDKAAVLKAAKKAGGKDGVVRDQESDEEWDKDEDAA